jgi:G protein beta subunit-like protein
MPITHFKAHAHYITRVLLSPDVKHLATCSADHTAKIWEVKDLDKMLARNNQAAAQAAAAAAAAAANPTPNANGESNIPPSPMPVAFKLESTLAQHQRWVWDCAFSADSAYLVTACSDHYARLWELHSEQIIRQYNGHHRGAVCVALNDYSDGR